MHKAERKRFTRSEKGARPLVLGRRLEPGRSYKPLRKH